MKRFRRLLIYVLLLAVVFAAIAFSAKQFSNSQLAVREVSIHGTVTRDGQPLQWKGENPKLWVIFQRSDVPGALAETYPADCDSAAGTFFIANIPKGRYKVSAGQHLGPEPLDPAFHLANATLECDVTHDGQQFRINLPKIKPESK